MTKLALSRLFYFGLFWSMAIFSYGQNVMLHSFTHTVSYNPTTCVADWVQWQCDTLMWGKADRKKISRFKEDWRVPKPRARHSDYTKSGYDRGHLCPAADFSLNITLMKETFVLSNVAPMTPRLNRGPWKATEDSTRVLARRYGKVDVIVYTFFPPSDTTRLRRSCVAIPYSFAKVVCAAGSDSILAEWHLTNE